MKKLFYFCGIAATLLFLCCELPSKPGPVYWQDIDFAEDTFEGRFDEGENKLVSSVFELNYVAGEYCDVFTDLNGLEQVYNLRYLELGNHNFSSIAPIGSLKYLSILELYNCAVTDITPLGKLKNLQSLDLTDNRISDISPLADCDALVSLDLSNNGFTGGLRDLAGLDSLNYINLIGNNNLAYADIRYLAAEKSELNIDYPELWIPAEPTLVSAVAAADSVKLTWSGNCGAERYLIYWQTSAGATGAGSVIDDSITDEYREHTGLSPGTYYYRIQAVKSGDGVHISGLSNELSATIE